MTIDQDKLSKVKKGLKHGSIITIARSIGVSRTTVYNVLNGKYLNADVLQACLTEYANQQNFASELKAQIEKIG